MAALVVGWAAFSVWLVGWQNSFNLTMPLALALLWLAVFTLACFGIGGPAWRAVIGRPPDSPADNLLVLALGAGALAACSGALGVVGLLTRPSVLLILAVTAGVGGISFHRRWVEMNWPSLPKPHAMVLIAAGVIAILGATSLAAFYDQWNYHLAFPFQWLREGGIFIYPRHDFSYFPANMGLLYVYGLAAGGGWTAQLIHFWMAALSVAAVGWLAGRFLASSGAVAAVMFAATPGVIELASVAGADLGVAAFFLCAWMAVLRATDGSEKARRWFLLTGLFVGLMVGCKYLAIPLLAIPFGLVLPLLIRSTNNAGHPAVASFNALVVVTSAAILIWSPWAVRNLVATGDPVYPYLSGSGIASNVPVNHDATELAEGIGGFGWKRNRSLYAATLGSLEYRDVGGRMGPLYVWLMPLWLIQLIRGKASRRERIFFLSLLLGVVGAAAVPSVGRYLIPLVAACAVGCGVAFRRLTIGLGKGWTTILNTTLFVVLVGNLNPFPLTHLARQIGVTLGVVEEADFLRTYVSHYPAIQYINSELPTDAVIYLLAESRSYEIERHLLLEDPASIPLVVEIAESSQSTEQMVEQFRALGVTHILINRLEANRIARYNNRSDYFVTDDPEARQRVHDFLGTLPIVWHDRHLVLFRLPQAFAARQ
jgi:4-amino-4-deoxy-L-arabinose transferase-like glycosyltransferase